MDRSGKDAPEQSRRVIAALVAMLAAVGCSQAPPKPDRVVTVRLSAPAPAGTQQVMVRVVEVSGPARAIIGTASGDAAQTEFRVTCPGARVRDEQSYGLEVVAVQDGKQVARNKSAAFVLTRGNPDSATVSLE